MNIKYIKTTDNKKYDLRDKRITDTDTGVATQSANGLLSSGDKKKLDGIASGAEVNQNAFSNIKIGNTTIAADGKTDTVELTAGNNITLTPDATNDKITIAATDTNTTYTFKGGTNQFTVTPSNGTAQTVSITPSIANNVTGSDLTANTIILGNGNSGVKKSGKTIVTTLGSDDTTLPTSKAVKAAIDALPEPMIFKGTLGTGGTITSLPTAAASNEGYTYKVITAGTYASQSAKVGDVFISNGSSWNLIPSGDEPSGTVTNIATGTGLTGGPITSSGTISHADTSSQASVSNSGRTYILSITLDGMGHVTGIASATETVTNTDINVRQTLTSSNWNLPLLMAIQTTSNTTTDIYGFTYRNSSIYANPSTGTITANKFISGMLELYPGDVNGYVEGIRIHPSNNKWTTLIFCGDDNTGTSGTSANSWSLHTYSGNFYINKGNANTKTVKRLWGHSNGYTIGNTDESGYNFTVGGTSRLIGTTTTSHILPASNDTYNIGSNTTEYANTFSKCVWAQEINSSAVTEDKDLHLGYHNTTNVNFYTTDASGNDRKRIALFNQNGNATFDNTVKAASFVGPLSGNASSASKLTTDAGSETQPVYFKQGLPIACSVGITATAPSSSSDDTTVPTSKAVWTAVSNGIATANAMIYRGTIAGGSTDAYGALTPFANKGWTYKVTTAGKINGKAVEIGDMLICNTDGTAAATSSNYSTIAANWDVIQVNIDGAVTGPASSTNAHVAVFNGATGKVIKDSSFTIGKSVPSDAVFTDTHYTTHLYAGSGTAANAATSNGNTKLTVVDNTTTRNSVTIKGTGETTVTSDENGTIFINSVNKTSKWFNFYSPSKVDNAFYFIISPIGASTATASGTCYSIEINAVVQSSPGNYIVSNTKFVTFCNWYASNTGLRLTYPVYSNSRIPIYYHNKAEGAGIGNETRSSNVCNIPIKVENVESLMAVNIKVDGPGVSDCICTRSYSSFAWGQDEPTTWSSI